jgi:hypothetical protein
MIALSNLHFLAEAVAKIHILSFSARIHVIFLAMPVDLIVKCPQCGAGERPSELPGDHAQCMACGHQEALIAWVELPKDADVELYLAELRKGFLRDLFYD